MLWIHISGIQCSYRKCSQFQTSLLNIIYRYIGVCKEIIIIGVLLDTPFHWRPPWTSRWNPHGPHMCRSLTKIWCLQWKYGVSNESMGSAMKIWGSPMKIWGSPTKIWGLPTRCPLGFSLIVGLQWKEVSNSTPKMKISSKTLIWTTLYKFYILTLIWTTLYKFNILTLIWTTLYKFNILALIWTTMYKFNIF